ncbi:transposase [Rhizobium leguminosarum bv. viciae]|nr:transposase [Rhizobium leguminosarum bv. viciae]
MSIEKHGSFLQRGNMPVAMTPAELDLPVDPGNSSVDQTYLLPSRSRFKILNARKNKIGHFQVDSYVDLDGIGGRFTAQNVISQSTITLSNWQIAQLERQGRFIPEEGKRPGKSVDTDAALDDVRRAAARRRMGYVQAIIRESDDGASVPSKPVMLRAAEKYAESIGERRSPSYGTLKKYLAVYFANPFARLLALAPGITRGNTIKDFSIAFEQLVALSVEVSFKEGGGWRKAEEIFHGYLADPEHEAVRREASDEHGNLIYPSPRTWQYRRAAVDPFTRDCWVLGHDIATRNHGIRFPQMLPDAPLDVVEMDYTVLDIIVFDDRFQFVYGKPWIGLMRDRKTGVVLGFTIFFGDPSFENFVHLLRTAISPKDLSAYPDIPNDNIYGWPLVIVIDCEPHLVSNHMVSLCEELGIQLRPMRPGEPNMKGGVERHFGVLQGRTVHTLPGTLRNPARRKDVSEEKELGLPKLTMKELEGYLHGFVYNYHRESHKGMGFLRTLPDVPLRLWKDGIAEAKPRRPIDHTILAERQGLVHYAVIRNGCFVVEHITYHHESLVVVGTAPTTKWRETGVETTKYKVIRDASDLGHAFVVVPELNITVEAFAINADKQYASGLRLFQHRKAMAEWKRRTKAPLKKVSDLEPMLGSYASDLKALYLQRKKQRTADDYLSFYASMGKRTHRSQVINVAHSAAASSQRMDYHDPLKAPPVMTPSPNDPTHDPSDTPVAPHARDEHGRLVPSDPLLEETAKHKNRKGKRQPTPRTESHPVTTGTFEDPDDIQSLIDRYSGDDE